MTDPMGGTGGPVRPTSVPTGSVVDGSGLARPDLVTLLRTRARQLARPVLVPVLGIALLAGAFALGRSTAPDEPAVVAIPGTSATTAPAATLQPGSGLTTAPVPSPSLTLARPLVPAAVEDLAAPLGISIPALDIAQGLIELGVTPDLALEVPQNGHDIGWWSTGPAPGEPGGTVIAAHVSYNGRAVFADLATLTDGAEVVVDRADGTAATYEVSRVESYAKADFPNELIYRRDGPPTLYLITCAGDLINGDYTENVVVFADLVGDTRLSPA